MKVRHFMRILMGVVVFCVSIVAQPRPGGQSPAPAKLYNTAKQKLLDGKQVFSFTQSKIDIDRLLRGGQALRLHVVRNAAQHAGV